jgi:poly(A) polymerase Pap1
VLKISYCPLKIRPLTKEDFKRFLENRSIVVRFLFEPEVQKFIELCQKVDEAKYLNSNIKYRVGKTTQLPNSNLDQEEAEEKQYQTPI